eukprot:COSAG04_NODE_17254_length_474_cov_1.082667_1_plen_70_part_01
MKRARVVGASMLEREARHEARRRPRLPESVGSTPRSVSSVGSPGGWSGLGSPEGLGLFEELQPEPEPVPV